MNWLFKEEPTHYGYDALVKDGHTQWAGVVGVCRALGDAYPDPNDRTGKAFVVDVAPVRTLGRPVTLAEIKARKAFASFPLTRIPRLSVMPVSDREWADIEKLAGAKV